MMGIKFLLALTIIAGAYASPIIENKTPHRWVSARDSNGNRMLIDLNPIESDLEPLFDPMVDLVYRLFTVANPTTPQVITHNMDSVRNSNWNSARPTRFLIHGWNGGNNINSSGSLRNAFLNNGDFNVVTVDWGAGGNTPNYLAARQRVGITGQAIATLINTLVQNGFTTHDRVNVVGHSLGAHVAGHTGKETNRLGGQLHAVFGTDAAGPLFNINEPATRLDIDDALYTENIHTDAGNLGFDQPITHAAFFPAWGVNPQPGCGDSSCSHGRANGLYAESLQAGHRLVARQCASYAEIVNRNCPGTGVTGLLGGDSAKSIRGVFFLNTNAQSPFGQG